VIPAATIKEVRFRISRMHLYMKLELFGSRRQDTFSDGEYGLLHPTTELDRMLLNER